MPNTNPINRECVLIRLLPLLDVLTWWRIKIDRLREMRLRSRKGSRAAQSAPMADCEHVTSGLDGSVAHYFRCKSTVSGDDRTVQNVHPIRETDSCSATDSGSNQDRSTRTSEPDPLCEAAQ
ncbi:hypothetical protein SPHINGOT1_280018 [Sphingomonas sp. T1]|nr:hypothetical protein SPHINGOT1_280018 [Sphingomonas sp. T1]